MTLRIPPKHVAGPIDYSLPKRTFISRLDHLDKSATARGLVRRREGGGGGEAEETGILPVLTPAMKAFLRSTLRARENATMKATKMTKATKMMTGSTMMTAPTAKTMTKHPHRKHLQKLHKHHLAKTKHDEESDTEDQVNLCLLFIALDHVKSIWLSVGCITGPIVGATCIGNTGGANAF